jgi:hypothetical protein
MARENAAVMVGLACTLLNVLLSVLMLARNAGERLGRLLRPAKQL